MEELSNSIIEIMSETWPMIILSCFILVILRLAYIIKNHVKFSLYSDLMTLLFIVYILCLFQIVTSQDVFGEHGVNITLFKELTRYKLGSRLFYRNVIGNILLFVPFGFFTSNFLKISKKRYVFIITFVVSIFIELIQLNIGRAFDVDDLFLNIIGGFLGYFMYKIIDKIFGRFSENIKALLTLLFIIIFISGLVIVIV